MTGESDPLAPVLELAVIVAQAGLRAAPPVPSPVALRPFLNFSHKIPRPALRIARKVLETDAEFRARVAAVATVELVGEAGTLFVQRPEGWSEKLADLDTSGPSSGSPEGSEALSPDDRKLAKRLAGTEQALRRAQHETQRAEEGLARVRADLAAAAAESAAHRIERGELEGRLADLQRTLEQAVAARDVARSEAEQAQAERDAARERVRGLEADLDELRDRLARLGTVDDAVARALVALDDLRAAVVASAVAERMTEAAVASSPAVAAEGRPTMATPTPSRAERSERVRRRHEASSRTPIRLGGGVLDDSPEAAATLLRAPGVLVLVDGYNVSKWRWTDLAAAEQRRRLIDLLSDLAARSAAEINVVFDGSEQALDEAVARSVRRLVRVTFSPGSVEADDVIIEAVEATPPHRPVVVVSSDRRVRDAVARVGANLVSTPQFWAFAASSQWRL